MVEYGIILIAVSVAAYALAVAHGRREVIDNLKEQVKVLGSELRDWQNKALLKHGSSPLGQVRKPEAIPYPRGGGVSLTTLKARAQKAQSAKYRRVTDRAKEVLTNDRRTE